MSIKKYIPDFITSMNLLCGVIGVVFAFKGRFDLAFYLMLAGAVCDFCDGLVARLLGAYSDLGKELDSLADLVSFGVLPSVMLYSLMKTFMFGENVFCWIPLLIAVFSGLRLAKFNLDARQSTRFIGLPTPANALFWGSLVLGEHAFLVSLRFNAFFLFLFMLLFCFLLVAEVPLIALKFKSLSFAENKVRYLFLAGCIPCFLLGTSCFAAIIVWYVAVSLCAQGRFE